MHYINGREAKEGDSVVIKTYNGYKAGTLHSLSATATTCNGQVAVPVPGGCSNICITLGKEALHAEDAFLALAPE